VSVSSAARTYTRAITGAGLLVLAGMVGLQLPGLLHDPSTTLIVLTAATMLAELAPVHLGPRDGEVAASTTFTYALLLSNGPAAAAIAAAVAIVVAGLVDRQPTERVALKVAQSTIALGLSGLVLDQFVTVASPVHFTLHDLPGIALSAATLLGVGAAFSAATMIFQGGRVADRTLWTDVAFHTATEGILIGQAPFALLALDYGPVVAPLLVLPLLAVQRAGRHASVSERLALHDTLTGLANRALFADRTTQALFAARRDNTPVAVMLIDLDRFKEINDTLGHHVGDDVLRTMSERFRDVLRDGDTVARLGGDEFAILLPQPKAPEDSLRVATKLRQIACAPISLSDDVHVSVDASIGIAWYPTHGDDVETLMQRADVAMYQAKRSNSGAAFYQRDRDDSSVAKLTLGTLLRTAVDEGSIDVHFQPKVNPISGTVMGAEALARWTHPERGAIPPSTFIPVAEQTGLIIPLTFHVLHEAMRQAGAWYASDLELDISVNVSARALLERTMPARIEGLLRFHQLPAHRLILEVTESAMLAESDNVVPVLERLVALGVTISVDDFGTGFSSLEYLKRLPVGELKIDRSFVLGLATDERYAAIVSCAVDLGHRLGLRVVAEGVESVEVRTALTRMGCDQCQGFLFSPAVPAEAFELEARRHLPPHAQVMPLGA
jgi:diguanylate cyclase (GGDEF)-like protein